MNDEGWAAGTQRSIHLHSLASLQGQDGNSAALTVQPWWEKGSALSCGLGRSGSAEPWDVQDQEQSGPSVSLDVFFHHLGIFQLGFRPGTSRKGDAGHPQSLQHNSCGSHPLQAPRWTSGSCQTFPPRWNSALPLTVAFLPSWESFPRREPGPSPSAERGSECGIMASETS
ncbi:PREDICTED: uncharacterized protein LOC108448835 isoform X2 [Corvus brachyrhynchos]|uniref:uncharacterized protein LOC108448835 isoform X2 n=1 Tax=Corvus brachyrhynchos TaxID=85066 RepID=UPI0008163AE7|nr:PREDICTED: uncharacterized protein LOC108448835 isoform X2 [Corvus brachyrhynchos]